MELGTRNCFYCGTRIYLKISRDVDRKKFCSRQCLARWNKKNCGFKHVGPHTDETKRKISEKARKNFVGFGNPRFIDGRRIFRKKLLESGQKQECYFCKESNKKLIVHHINPCERKNDFGKNPSNGDHSIDNARWLCYSCHKKLHNFIRKGE